MEVATHIIPFNGSVAATLVLEDQTLFSLYYSRFYEGIETNCIG